MLIASVIDLIYLQLFKYEIALVYLPLSELLLYQLMTEAPNWIYCCYHERLVCKATSVDTHPSG